MFSGIAGLLPEFGLTGLSGICATIQAMLVSGALYHRLRNLNYERLIQLTNPLRKGNRFAFKSIESLAFSRLQRSPEL
jgi:hypothetical protein